MAGNPDSQYNIYDIGFDKSLMRNKVNDPEIPAPDDTVSQDPTSGSSTATGGTGGSGDFSGGLVNPVQGMTPASSIAAGEIPSLLGFGKKLFTDTTAGLLMGVDTDNIYKWIIGDSSSSADWAVTTAATLTIKGAIVATTGTIGGFNIGSDYIRDVGNSFGLASTVTGGDDVRFWAGDTYANRSTAPLRVTEAGAIVATSATITGSITATGGSFGGFTIGSDYLRDAANSFGLASTVTGGDDVRFWSGDTFANRATAPFRITESGVVVGTSVTMTGTIQATGGYVGSTTALVYEAQGINTGTTGHIRGGMTAYDTGTGYFLGYAGGTYVFSIGNGSDTSQLLDWNGTTLIVNGSPISNQDLNGDGSDGDVTLGAGTTTLSADMFYNNLTVPNGSTLNTASFRVFCKTSLTVASGGSITNNGASGGAGGNATSTTGGAGTAGAAGAAIADGSLKGALAGVAGVAGKDGVNCIGTNGHTNGTNGNGGGSGTSVVKSMNSNGVTGAAGGDGGRADGGLGASGGTGGAGGGGGSVTGTLYNKIHSATAAYNLFDIYPESGGFPKVQAVNAAPSNGGAASGASGGTNSANPGDSAASGSSGGSGAGGSNGGIISIFAKKITNSGTISANGGAGGNAGTSFASAVGGANASAGGTGGSAGGHGGNGGLVILVYSTLTNSGTIQAAGGAGGTGASAGAKATVGSYTANSGTSGANGSTGNVGVVIQLQV